MIIRCELTDEERAKIQQYLSENIRDTGKCVYDAATGDTMGVVDLAHGVFRLNLLLLSEIDLENGLQLTLEPKR